MGVVYERTEDVPTERGWHRPASIEREDGGAALIVNFPTDEDSGIFVRVQSYDDQGEHELEQILGKRVRVTVEVLS